MNTFKIRKHKRIQNNINMHDRSIEHIDRLIDHHQKVIKKLISDRYKDDRKKIKSMIALSRNIAGMSEKEFNSIK